MATREVAEAIDRCFISPNCADAFGQPANVVDGLYVLASAVRDAAKHLGTGDAATSMGAIEALSVSIKEGCESIGSAIETLARSTGGN